MAEADQDNEAGRKSLGAGVRDAYAKIPPTRRRLILIAAGGVLLALVLLVVMVGGGDRWRPVARGMVPEDLDAATKAFDEKKIPYQLADGGSVLVPEEQIHEARLALAVQAMPSGKTVGFEVFDESGMGRSAFTEKVNLHRALEGELARTIRHIESIERARVHLVIPERRVLKELEVAPSASVIVALKPGQTLTRETAQAIRQLVAGAVERLQPSAVSIVDQHGHMLTRPDDGAIGGGDRFEREEEHEQALEQRVIQLLEPMVGKDKVIARVAIDFDTSRVVETVEDFDPTQQVVRSEREQIDRAAGGGAVPAGPPGTASNLPGRAPAIQTNPSDAAGREKSDTIRNYEMDKTVTRTEDPLPRVRKLSVAVLVDEASELKGEVWKARPRTAEELAQLSRLVAHAVGLDTARGDQLEVTSAPFAPPPGGDGGEGAPAATPAPGPQETEWWQEPVVWIAAGGALLLLIAVVLAVALASRRKRALVPVVPAVSALIGDAPVLGTSTGTPADRRARVVELRERMVQLGNEDVHRLAAVFHRWFQESDVAGDDKEAA